jgi:adenine C2-methylase RlmN of 23S rRNA A2503 and tRNA A37
MGAGEVLQMRILKSNIDESVNFVWDREQGQAVEARYVRRDEDYFACYISSQTACAKACRMCHLTQSGQNKPQDVHPAMILEQAKTVFEHYRSQPAAKRVHFNFMARGEPLASKVIREENWTIFSELCALALVHNLIPRVLISTIMPEEVGQSLVDIFPVHHPDIYYSIYSTDSEFRRRWVPNAKPAEEAMEILAEWQTHSKKIPCLHWALIEDENDSIANADAILDAAEKVGLRANVSLVHYNPYSDRQGEEAIDQYDRTATHIQGRWPQSRVKTVSRVGMDIAASCGMFVS